ncbi:hypothetical protein CesoFtcFv8_023754 [Champsocephalus esox]|uniref:Uncharacterized protein n=1 Tax=Champsocephalus esox TaxID=159716 RepID=A0AAN8B4X3_9TELE|nr:hypothetical protein CesoFtcFv8_023754 [Champsocephalus esox]
MLGVTGEPLQRPGGDPTYSGCTCEVKLEALEPLQRPGGDPTYSGSTCEVKVGSGAPAASGGKPHIFRVHM